MPLLSLFKKSYTDAQYVEGVCNHNPAMEKALYKHCKSYFNDTFNKYFFIDSSHKDEIFQESFIVLWEHIERRRIYVEDGMLKGPDGKPFKSALTTYLFSIASNKYKEWCRDNIAAADEEIRPSMAEPQDETDDTLMYQDKMREIVADCIAIMSEQCRIILTLFYYEGQNLDEILQALPSYKDKNTLKTRKNKCLDKLRENANNIYNNFLKKESTI